MLRKLTFLILLLSIKTFTYAQSNVYILQGDSITLPCSLNCLELSSVHPSIKKTDTYTLSPITYAPVAFTGTNVSLIGDDYFSNTIPIGFTFCFYNQSYTQLCISDNGQITFNTNYANMPSSFAMLTPLPFYNNAFPDNAIFGPMIDAKLSLGGDISYTTIGTAPFRKFIVKYNAVPYFNNSCTNTNNNNFQIILYESTNNIECHITNKEVCNSNPSIYLNYATLGIQNTNATQFLVAPNKNASIWTATNQAWQFAPNGINNYTLEWRNNSNNLLSTLDSFNYCPTSANDIITLQFHLNCNNYNFNDNISINTYKPIAASYTIIQPMCPGATTGCITVNATAINPPLQYSINNGAYTSSNVFCNLVQGAYLISIKDANGCILSSAVTVNSQNYNFKIKTDSIHNASCLMSDGFISIHDTGGTKPYTYLWSTGSTDTMINNLNGGNYTITTTDANGCSTSSIINVPLLSGVNDNSILNYPTCYFANGSIFLNPSGLAPFYYLWNTGDTTSSLQNIPDGVYSVKVIASNGCKSIFTYTLTPTLNTKCNYNVTDTKCNLANGIINLNGYNSVAPYTFYLNNILQTTLPIQNVAAGTYNVKTVDANGCSTVNTITILPSVAPNIQFNPSSPNCDSINGKIGVTVKNAIGTIYYYWSNNSTKPMISGLDTGFYFVNVTDSSLCTVSDSIHLTRTPSPHLIVNSYTAPICFGDATGSVSLQGVGGIPSYKYSVDQINFNAVAQINNIKGGIYPIVIKDASGCIRDTIVNFPQPDSFYAIVNGLKTFICYNDILDSITIIAKGGTPNYLYSFDNSNFSSNSVFYKVSSSNHTLKIKDSNNCIFTKNIIADAPQSPLLFTYTKDDVACFETNNGKIDAKISGGWGNYNYTWSNNATTLLLENLTPNFYKIIISDDKGCTIKDSIKVLQTYCCTALIPTAFSPNGDNKNDILYVQKYSDISSVRLRIYNRYGIVVFETQNINNGWDGTYKGEKCDFDTYFYILEFNCPFETKKITLKGDVTLVR